MTNTVLVLDDDPMAVELAQCSLEECGYHVVSYTDPKEALKAFEREHIDAALIDLRLPGTTGREVIKSCNHIQKDCSFFVISGHISVKEFIHLQNSGVVDCFQKPVDMKLIVKAISTVLDRQNEMRPANISKDAPIAI